MNRFRSLCAHVFLVSSLAATMTGCNNRLVTGIRNVFFQQPADAVAKAPIEPARPDQQADAQSFKPVVTIVDSAGQPAIAEADADDDEDGLIRMDGVVTSEEAARYRELAITKPHDPIVRYNMGRLYLQQGLLKEATYEFDMATSLDSGFASGFFLLGRTLRLRGAHDLAVAKLNMAARLEPGSPLPLTEIGICWDQRGFHDRAQEAYQKALALSPDDSRIYNNLGYSYFAAGDYKGAIKQYAKALDLNPDDPQTHNNIALAYAMQEKWNKALEHFTKALGEAAAQNNVGHLLLRAGRVDEALAHLEVAVRLNPKSVRALGNMESALRLKGRIDEAEKLHARLVEVERSQATPGVMTATGAASTYAGRK